ncbi:MAG: tetratricopeptide repeat protein [Oleiphilaceae bacterium]|nr:tetratricopeptide repeat protein [Oleiphilaceae bacterium]
MSKKKKRQTGSPRRRTKLSAQQQQQVLQLMQQGLALHRAGQLVPAVQYYQQVLAIDPLHIDARQFLASVAEQQGQIETALKLFHEVVELDPKRHAIHFMLGKLYHEANAPERALEFYRKSVMIAPAFLEGWNNLGLLYKERHAYADAVACFEQALKHHPRHGLTWSNLGNALKDWGKMQEAVPALRKAGEMEQGLSAAYSNYLVALNYLDDIAPGQIYSAHTEWPQHVPAQLEAERFAFNDRAAEPNRTLRIGYVSPDLHRHSVAYFIESVFEKHSDAFEVFVYDCDTNRDEINQRLRTMVHTWRDVKHLSDSDLANQIYDDHIDILIDLCGHMADNRLPVFYQKPAPIQVTWLGYPNTTGLTQIDYRVSDAIADPPGDSDTMHTEKLLRLEGGFLCFTGDAQAPEIAASPYQRAGHFTFGSFNNAVKISDSTLDAWQQILVGTTNTRLLIKAAQLKDETFRARLLERFTDAGISTDRVEFMGLIVDSHAHLAKYHEVDLALDTFPYNGTTTTCEAAWMGVPTLCLSGQTHAARVGASLLHRLDLDQFVAHSIEDYVSKAIGFAQKPDVLTAIRPGLRRRFEKTALGNSTLFVAELEQALRKVWVAYCQKVEEGN